jgi:hypothetical protein
MIKIDSDRKSMLRQHRIKDFQGVAANLLNSMPNAVAVPGRGAAFLRLSPGRFGAVRSCPMRTAGKLKKVLAAALA